MWVHPAFPEPMQSTYPGLGAIVALQKCILIAWYETKGSSWKSSRVLGKIPAHVKGTQDLKIQFTSHCHMGPQVFKAAHILSATACHEDRRPRLWTSVEHRAQQKQQISVSTAVDANQNHLSTVVGFNGATVVSAGRPLQTTCVWGRAQVKAACPMSSPLLASQLTKDSLCWWVGSKNKRFWLCKQSAPPPLLPSSV